MGSFRKIVVLALLLIGVECAVSRGYGQAVPGTDENIPYLVTFGKDGETSWGDPHFYQIFFFAIPRDYTGQFYIRVFDPDCGGEHDELKFTWNTRTLFSVYGGQGVDPNLNEESRGLNKGDNYKKGNLLASRAFGEEPRYDDQWFTFGPFNPTSGDFSEQWNSYLFKIVSEGIAGDDGNMFRYFLSKEADANVPIEGGNAFTYSYTFRLWNENQSVSHIYPYVDTGVVYIRQRNFDWDDDGKILVVSRYKQGIELEVSGEDEWVEGRVPIEQAEIGSSLDFQFHKRQDFLVRNNNVVITIESQRGDALPFFSSPIGGVPVYQPVIQVRQKPR
jgi:hypothetical protein